jgi:hypothetical protein
VLGLDTVTSDYDLDTVTSDYDLDKGEGDESSA